MIYGDMAQLVERLVRNEKASGSNPLISTINNDTPLGVFFVLMSVTLEQCILSGSCEQACTSILLTMLFPTQDCDTLANAKFPLISTKNKRR